MKNTKLICSECGKTTAKLLGIKRVCNPCFWNTDESKLATWIETNINGRTCSTVPIAVSKILNKIIMGE